MPAIFQLVQPGSIYGGGTGSSQSFLYKMVETDEREPSNVHRTWHGGARVDVKQIVAELKSEQQRLDQAIKAMEQIRASGASAGAGFQGRKLSSGLIAIEGGKKRRLSAAGRKRISDAQKRRWAKIKKAA